MRAWRSLQTLQDPQAALAWICGIARHAAQDAARSRARRATQPLLDDDDGTARSLARQLCDPKEDALAVCARAEARALVRRGIDALPEQHRVVLMLREIDGLTYDEVAAALGVPVGTVDSRLFRARRALAAVIEKAARTPRRWPW